MLAVPNVHPLGEVAHQSGGIFLVRVQMLKQMFVLTQTQDSSINLAVSDPAPQLRQNIIRDVDHGFSLGTVILKPLLPSILRTQIQTPVGHYALSAGITGASHFRPTS